MDLGLQKYRAFIEVARTESFTKTAARLGYTQSGISRMIASLEAEVGLALFARDHGRVVLTNEGRALLPRMAELCEQARLLEEQADALKGLETGSIRIGTISSIATHWLPDMIARFKAAYPGIDYELRLGDYAEIEAWIEEGSVDCGFLRLPTKKSLRSIELAQDEFKVIVPEGHEYADAETFPVERLAEYPFMELTNGSVSDVAFIFDAHGLEIRPTVTTWDDHAIMAMVESGLGIAILPALVLRNASLRIRALSLDQPAFRTLGFAVSAKRSLPIAVQTFQESFEELKL